MKRRSKKKKALGKERKRPHSLEQTKTLRALACEQVGIARYVLPYLIRRTLAWT